MLFFFNCINRTDAVSPNAHTKPQEPQKDESKTNNHNASTVAIDIPGGRLVTYKSVKSIASCITDEEDAVLFRPIVPHNNSGNVTPIIKPRPSSTPNLATVYMHESTGSFRTFSITTTSSFNQLTPINEIAGGFDKKDDEDDNIYAICENSGLTLS